MVGSRAAQVACFRFGFLDLSPPRSLMSSRLLRNGPRRFFHWSMCMTQLMNTYGTRTLTLARGEGSYVWDDQGKRYLDAISGIAVCGLGHAHPALAEALSEQAQRLLHTSNLYNIPEQQRLGELLCEVSEIGRASVGKEGRARWSPGDEDRTGKRER